MESKLCWHRAAELSGRVDFSFMRTLSKEHWQDHLYKSIQTSERLNRLYTPLPEPEVPYIRLIDKDYPALLAAHPFAPPVIYLEGNRELLHRPCLSVVGSRKSTWLGRQFATRISQHGQKLGYAIVSGLAYGIDEAAHRGALANTIGIMGQGILTRRSGARARLSADIIRAGGLLISEFPPL